MFAHKGGMGGKSVGAKSLFEGVGVDRLGHGLLSCFKAEAAP